MIPIQIIFGYQVVEALPRDAILLDELTVLPGPTLHIYFQIRNNVIPMLIVFLGRH
jgi:hypothetical protein